MKDPGFGTPDPGLVTPAVRTLDHGLATCDNLFQRRRGISAKACLQRAHDRLTELRKRGPGPRCGANVIGDDFRCGIDDDLEQLFTRLRMIGEGAVGVTEPGAVRW